VNFAPNIIRMMSRRKGMGGGFSTRQRNEKCVQVFGGKARRTDISKKT
jgi:hypothetical protein